jgi:hypothetical protein
MYNKLVILAAIQPAMKMEDPKVIVIENKRTVKKPGNNKNLVII